MTNGELAEQNGLIRQTLPVNEDCTFVSMISRKSSLMKLLSRIGISLATLIMTAAPGAVQAQVSGCFFPFWGGYGYGYGAPSYGGYYAGYSPMWGAPAPMGLYSASYARFRTAVFRAVATLVVAAVRAAPVLQPLELAP